MTLDRRARRAAARSAKQAWRPSTSTIKSGTEIVDRTRATDDAVTPVAGGAGQLLYRDCDFGP